VERPPEGELKRVEAAGSDRNSSDKEGFRIMRVVVIALSDPVRVLVFPLIVLVAGTAFLALLFPALTRREGRSPQALRG
jgi:hypothetical protein